MIKIALTVLQLTIPAQYGGPPMWSRDYRDYPPEPRMWRYGPQMEPCIYHDDCRGPRDRDFRSNRPYGMPPFRLPPRGRYYDEF